MLAEYIFRLRFISIVAVFFSFLSSLLMFYIGAAKTITAFAIFFSVKETDSKFERLETTDLATSYLIKSIDAFLIALVLLIFSYGVYVLFIGFKNESSDLFKWLDISSVGHLKNTLAEVIIVILFVKFLEVALLNLDNLAWEILILPVSILLLALSLKFLELRHH